jgi:perosamine synthetase
VESYQQLEKEIAAWAEQKHIVACASGTAALHLALESLRCPPGSEIICPEYTMIACPRAIALAGLKPVFVDCGPDLLINLDEVEMLLSSSAERQQIVGIMPVHVYGRRCDMHRLWGMCRYKNMVIVEDMAELHGVAPHPMSDAACWSFYRNKVVAGEEGGAVSFYNGLHAELARSLRCLGFTNAHDYNHLPRGHNYRLSNLHAQPIIDSLQQFSTNLKRRQQVVAWVDEECPEAWKMPLRISPWVYDIRIPGLNPATQDTILRELNRSSITARHGFQPMSWQEEFKKCRRTHSSPPVAARASMEVFYLGINPLWATEEGEYFGKGQIKKTFEIVKKIVGAS